MPELATVRRVFLTAVALSVVHYADNTVNFDDYDNGGTPGFITQASIPVSWVAFTVAGVGGYLLFRRGKRPLAAALLGLYSISGLIGPLHYTDVPPGDFAMYQNVFIVTDTLAGIAVAVLAFCIAAARADAPYAGSVAS